MLNLHFQDHEWPYEFTDHDREVVRAIVVDNEGAFYFCRAVRDDDFGQSTLIETSGGGVEPGEDLVTAIRRELLEELGVTVEVLAEIGLVTDYYNLIHRRNHNHYYLCRALGFGARALTEQEANDFHLSVLKLSYEEALLEYDKCSDSRLGRLIAQRELPVLREAARLLREHGRAASGPAPDHAAPSAPRDAAAEKKHQLFLRQKALLDTFLSNGAISQAQYDKSFGDLKEKMGEN